MAKFGQYEIDRPLYRTGFNAIYLWQSDTRGFHRRVIKAYQPPEGAPDERPAVRSAVFLDSAAIQQKVAGEDARYWAPIHESGASPEGSFYVTDYYDLSAQQLIDGRVNLSAAGLCRIVESVVRGLLALKHACGRPHGNLKFTNILIARGGALTKERIVLSDPCPSSQLDEDTHAKMDLRQIGTLIHQLVTHRNPPLVAGYRAPDSQEWQKLGRHADAWRAVCNRLLTMDVEGEPISLEELVAKLPGVACRARNRALKVIACACGIVLLAVLYRPVARLAMDILHPPDPEEARMAYLQCCQAGSWLSPLWYKLAEKVPGIDRQRYAYWRKEGESLKRLVGLIETYGEPFKTSETRLDIPVSPPEKLANSRRYQRDVIDANDARAEIEAFLSNGEAGWSLPKELAGRAAGLREARCESMAVYMATLLGAIQDRDERLAERIDDILYLKNNWYAVQYADLEPNAVGNDPNLAAAVQSPEDFVKRLHRLPDHYRQEIDAFKDLLIARERLQGLLKEVIDSGDVEAEKLQARLETLVSPRIAQIRSTPFTRANAPRLTDECRVAQDLIGDIERQIRGPDQWFDEWRTQAEKGICSSPATNRAYVARLEAWIGRNRGVFADKYKGRWKDLRTLRDKVAQTRDNLLKLNACLPETIAFESASAAWPGAICEYYANNRREGLITEITDKLAQQESVPDPNGYPEDCRRLLDWPGQAVALMHDFTDIERCLDNCYLLDERPEGARADIQSLYLDPNNRRILEEGSITQILTPVIARLENLKRIRDINDIDSLLSQAKTSARLETRYAAWQKLVSLPLVEEKWRDEDDVGSQLKAELDSRREDTRLTEMRRLYLTERIKQTSEARERQFRHINIDRLTENVALKAKGTGVAFLEQLGKFKPGNDADLSELRVFQEGLKSLLDNHLDSADWPAQYDLNQFDADHHLAQANAAVAPEWLSEMSQYRRIEDRRDVSRWDEKRSELGRNIDEGLTDMADDTDVRDQLTEAKTGLGELDEQFRKIRDLPAIEKHRTEVEKSSGLWDQLNKMEDRVNSLVHPAYRHLTFRNGPAAFKDGLGLDRFEPVDPRLAPFTRADLKDEFFKVIDRRDKRNAGWPTFIRARADNTVILVFVPGDAQAAPFYISRCEITNRQYARFLKSARPADYEDLVRDTLFKRTHPYPSAIDPDTYDITDPNRVDHPVVWVTYEGANMYAHWLSAVLPKVSWYKRAIEYSHPKSAKYADPGLYHIRTTAWAKVVREYNEKCGSESDLLGSISGRMPAPLGAVHEFGKFTLGQPLPDPIIQLEPGIYPSAWPMPSHPVPELTISDLIGNVWEWCEDSNGKPAICGGSCLAPLESIGPDAVSAPPERGAECDLGLRVAVACP
jgi:hypothetical protein